ncbi:GyrI-like domain-containing protein [Paenibacillus elgii]|nr:GyrI-like domain-containing protein [Paenibacillus elgii]
MGDVDGKFERWKNEGKYLAGCEVLDDVEAPHGWVKWVIPSFKYIVVKCNLNSYKETFIHIIEDHLPNNGYTLVGAVHEFYDPKDNNGELSLFFPIEKI